MKQDKAPNWTENFPGAITVCDMDGIILEMNARAKESFARYGGADLIGKDLRDCHPPAARAKIDLMLVSGETNAYTIEKGGKRKFIYQCPWFGGENRMGLVEISLEIPENMPHFKRP